MTETEWLGCTDPTTMLATLPDKTSERKLRLFMCACCRHIWPLLLDRRSRRAVETAERYADQLATEEELLQAQEEATRAARELVRAEAHAAAEAALVTTSPATAAWQTAWAVVRSRVKDVSREIVQREAVRGAALAELAVLLRDLFGDPFRPVPLDSTWLTPAVRSVAKVAYDERRFEDLPVLADALEEAGCDSADILSHCRGPGRHVRGCWVLDMLLDKK